VTVHIAAAAIRPAAVLPVESAVQILDALAARDVSRGGLWNATAGVWQRYDRPWTGPAGSRGGAELVGSIAVVYDRPRRHEITLFKVTLTAVGREHGFTADSLCDDALAHAGLSLATCPRAELETPPGQDPFADREHVDMPRQRTLGELLNTDVLTLIGLRRA